MPRHVAIELVGTAGIDATSPRRPLACSIAAELGAYTTTGLAERRRSARHDR